MNYTMSQVTTLTGIKGHTLRVWERRFNFMIAKRKDSGIRYYSEKQVKDLLNVSLLLKSGNRISSIVKMNSEEVFTKTQEIYATSNEISEIQVQFFLQAMISYDEVLFTSKFEQLETEMGLLELMTNIIYPLLRRIGGLWTNEKAIPAHEHFISNLIRQKVISAIDLLPTNTLDNKSIVLFLPEGEDHELGLLLASYLLKKMKWKVIYLGIRVPIKNLQSIIQDIDCNHAFTMLRFSRKGISDNLLEILEQNKGFNILVSGSQDLLSELSKHERCTFLVQPTDLLNYKK